MRSLTLLFLSVLSAYGQVTWQDYKRDTGSAAKYTRLLTGAASGFTYTPDSASVAYRVTVEGGARFVLFDRKSKTKKAAFDHQQLAASLSRVVPGKFTAITLPFRSFTYVDGGNSIRFDLGTASFQCRLSDSQCRKLDPAEAGFRRGPEADEDAPAEPENPVVDGIFFEYPQQGAGGARRNGPENGAERVATSPDGKYDAFIQNYNVYLREHGKTVARPLSYDGSEGNYYTFASLLWSPDSSRLVAYHTRPGYKREVHYIESSPKDQLQPKHSTIDYNKPGDVLDQALATLFDIAGKKQIQIDSALFPNAFSLTRAAWRKDSRAFTFGYNQRGHQLYRIVEVDTAGRARAVITEESKTFIEYRPLAATMADTGKIYRADIEDGKEVIWMSERDGWAHLYLFDGVTGRVKNQITKGEWVVRSVEKVDEAKRQIWFSASGMNPGEDPYFVHYYRTNFDGTGLVKLSEAPGNHKVTFAPDMLTYVDEWSTTSQPSVAQLRETASGAVISTLEKTDASKLMAAGWIAPEVFTAKGRDQKTDIWGVIWKPRNFDPAKKYPVIEYIYAGPQGSFVPKTFSASVQPLTELGFVVAQIDGMGTNNRSKAFHDVAFQNLGDAGFPDRILWHKAVAAKYRWYDISRVGIFGTSAGGQNALGGMLFHPEFYKAAVSNSGCHDNRMDKIWWNELWMGWPLGPHYAASSNVDNAYRLEGKLLLIVGEMDTNVDPSSTLQVVNALMQANKKFDLLFVPGGGHGSGGLFGTRLQFDFFVHHLLGQEPPKWQASRENSGTGERTM